MTTHISGPYRRRDLIGCTITWHVGPEKAAGTIVDLDDDGGLAIYVPAIDRVIHGQPPTATYCHD
jgi:hypothetical protein